MQINIRKAESVDYISIGSLIKDELGYQHLDMDKLFDRLDIMEADDKHLMVVAEIGNQVIGFIGIYKGIAYNYDGEYIQIIALAVLATHQSRGVGSQLLKWVEDYAEKQGIRSFGVNSGLLREKAHIFYERNGYIKRALALPKIFNHNFVHFPTNTGKAPTDAIVITSVGVSVILCSRPTSLLRLRLCCLRHIYVENSTYVSGILHQPGCSL